MNLDNKSISYFLEKNNFHLGGSRYFSRHHPYIIKISSQTDFDLWGQASSENENILRQMGFAKVISSSDFQIMSEYYHENYAIDETVDSIWTRGYGIQVILRKDVEFYCQVWYNLSVYFWSQHVWKSGALSLTREQVQSTMKFLFDKHRANKVSYVIPEIPDDYLYWIRTYLLHGKYFPCELDNFYYENNSKSIQEMIDLELIQECTVDDIKVFGTEFHFTDKFIDEVMI